MSWWSLDPPAVHLIKWTHARRLGIAGLLLVRVILLLVWQKFLAVLSWYLLISVNDPLDPYRKYLAMNGGDARCCNVLKDFAQCSTFRLWSPEERLRSLTCTIASSLLWLRSHIPDCIKGSCFIYRTECFWPRRSKEFFEGTWKTQNGLHSDYEMPGCIHHQAISV